jgi:hypothetical protein
LWQASEANADWESEQWWHWAVQRRLEYAGDERGIAAAAKCADDPLQSCWKKVFVRHKALSDFESASRTKTNAAFQSGFIGNPVAAILPPHPSFVLETTVLPEAGWWAPSDAVLDAGTILYCNLALPPSQ